MPVRPLVLSLVLALSTPLAALAQSPARTGTGGGPSTTDRAANVTATGQTKPPSRDASPAGNNASEQQRAQDRVDSQITKGICIGCSPR